MGTERTCVVVVGLLILFARNCAPQRDYGRNSNSFAFRPSASGYSSNNQVTNSHNSGKVLFGDGSSSSAYEENGKLNFQTYNGGGSAYQSSNSKLELGYDRGTKPESNRRTFEPEKTNQWNSDTNWNSNGIQNGGFSPGKNQVYQTSNSNNANYWNSAAMNSKKEGGDSFGFPNEERRTEGSKKVSGGDANTNWNSGLGSGTKEDNKPGINRDFNSGGIIGSSSWNSGFGSDSKKTDSNWNSGFNYEPKTERYDSFSSNKDDSKRRPGNIGGYGSSSSSSNWNFGFESDSGKNKKPESNWNNGFQNPDSEIEDYSSSGYSSSKKDETERKPNVNGWNVGGGSSHKPSGVNNWKSGKKPEDESRRTEKPTTPRPNKKKQEPDWAGLEKENKKGPLNLDLSQLWDSRQRKSETEKKWSRHKKRHVFIPDCHCTEYDECPPERRMDVTNFLKNGDDGDLRIKMVDCAMRGKICCTNPTVHTSEHQARAAYLRPACGIRTVELPMDGVSDDGLADYGDLPWMLRLVDENENTICSAVLIHRSVALTTATCALLISEEVRVRAGEWNSGTGHDRNKIQEMTIGKILLHPDFDFNNRVNDLALLFLEMSRDNIPSTKAVCLPAPHDVWDSSRCVIAGWTGKDIKGLIEPALWKIDPESVAQGKCRNDSDGENEMEDSRFLCAFYRNGSPCLGDVGAALMCPISNSDMFVNVGFISHPPNCNDFYSTATFTNVFESLDWVTRMEGIYLYVTGDDME